MMVVIMESQQEFDINLEPVRNLLVRLHPDESMGIPNYLLQWEYKTDESHSVTFFKLDEQGKKIHVTGATDQLDAAVIAELKNYMKMQTMPRPDLDYNIKGRKLRLVNFYVEYTYYYAVPLSKAQQKLIKLKEEAEALVPVSWSELKRMINGESQDGEEDLSKTTDTMRALRLFVPNLKEKLEEARRQLFPPPRHMVTGNASNNAVLVSG
ncbi:MAG: hypothetical protein JW774_11225 [Candidatus Aureabacteria bacterium]|nr:hypothetical protein [Candidatus Auribacterota bacterium]